MMAQTGMGRRLLAAALLAAAASLPLPAQQPDISSPALRIEWAEFKKLHDAGKVVVVDVRDAAAFAAGHIPGARLVPLDQVETRAGELKALKKPIVLYCA